MRIPPLALVLAPSLALLAGIAAPPAAPEPLPLSEQLLRMLRTRDVVIPEPPASSPVHALANREAIIPPQCYTRTEGRFNPCYVCHQDALPSRENTMDDADLQEAYSFSDVGLTNHWKNLFEDRAARIAAISDAEILEWVSQDNYSALPGRLREAGFQGFIPDLTGLEEGAAAFDEQGFARDGSHWVAFSYKPFPSTFWPTNGSTDDVMIRLPAAFRTTAAGEPSRDVYAANLAILEANIKGVPAMGCLPLDEKSVGEDLDGDGALGVIRRVTRVGAWVGAARKELCETFLYPEGTELLHTVRYLAVSPGGGVGASRRMKEVRYMRKVRAYRKPVYAREYQLDAYDKELGNLPRYARLGDHGLDNGTGWAIAGFIEGRDGRLRVQSHEENMACMGCHGSIGSTIDKTFSLPRKVDGAEGWKYIDLRGMPDAPNAGESQGEILTYFERVGGGDEFRSNPEMLARWFDAEGKPDVAKVLAAPDVHSLIVPSAQRALLLDKAYRVLVADQDYIHGRDAMPSPPAGVYASVDNESSPTLPADRVHRWDIRLDWARADARPDHRLSDSSRDPKRALTHADDDAGVPLRSTP